jgi:DnaJ-class molecular chaperone
MEKHPHKTICSDCKGNGFIYINVPSYDEVKQCKTCNSQGEFLEDKNWDCTLK